MKETTITIAEAARNFVDCVDRAHYQNETFVLMKNGIPFARIVPDCEKICTGNDLANILAEAKLSEEEAEAWCQDLHSARKTLKIPINKWQ